jgi:hypothetical protein
MCECARERDDSGTWSRQGMRDLLCLCVHVHAVVGLSVGLCARLGMATHAAHAGTGRAVGMRGGARPVAAEIDMGNGAADVFRHLHLLLFRTPGEVRAAREATPDRPLSPLSLTAPATMTETQAQGGHSPVPWLCVHRPRAWMCVRVQGQGLSLLTPLHSPLTHPRCSAAPVPGRALSAPPRPSV